MTPYQFRLNRYIERMAKDMKIRNMAQSTIDAYTWHVTKFCEFFDSRPEKLGPEEIRKYQLYMIEQKKSSWSSFNQAVCGLRFLYEVSLKRHLAVRHIPFGKRSKKLPVVLSDQEAIRLIQCVDNPKHRMILLTCYATGMRLREATNLRLADVDGDRQQIRITCAKGSQERLVPASPRLLDELRGYWKLDGPRNYLFPGATADTPLSSATVQKACKLGPAKAQINKTATPHTMRHTFATSMLEEAEDDAEPGTELLGRDRQYECPHCEVALECTSNVRRPSWKQVFEREVYREASICCPLLHIFQRIFQCGPPKGSLA